MKRMGIAATLVAAIGIGVVAPAQAGEWMAMSREGGCMTFEQAAQRRVEFQGVANPSQLAAKLRAEGVDVKLTETNIGDVKTIEFEAPQRNLFMMFVSPTLCDRMNDRHKRR